MAQMNCPYLRTGWLTLVKRYILPQSNAKPSKIDVVRSSYHFTGLSLSQLVSNVMDLTEFSMQEQYVMTTMFSYHQIDPAYADGAHVT